MKFKFATVAAAMLAATGAQAADLGRPAPAAVDYVKVCDAYGAGFFYIPGSQTCLKIGGFVRAEWRAFDYDKAFAKRANKNLGTDKANSHDFMTRARIGVNLDTRTNTEFGLLRSYTEFWITHDSPVAKYSGADAAGQPGLTLWNAFIQWGGLTAGRATSMFDFYAGSHYSSVFETSHADAKVNLLAYTFSFGNGVTATLSLEDPTVGSTNRRYGSVAHFVAPTTNTYGGVKWLDVVGNVKIDQAWGSAQLMAAAHQNTSALTKTTEWGWAVGAGVKVNLPMIAAGDNINLQAAYTEGAVGYVAADLPFGAFDFRRFGNKLHQTEAWAVAGGFTHFWIPGKLSTSATASYFKHDAYLTFFDYDQTDAGINLVWTAAPGLTFGAELEYKSVDFANSKLGDADALVALFRIQRTF